MTNRKDLYQTKAWELLCKCKELRKRNKAFIATELATFTAAVALAALWATTGFGNTAAAAGAAALLAGYAATRRLDSANSRRIERYESLREVYENELRYLAGDFSHFDDGARYADPDHPFAFDMDVFGSDSLYNRICRCATSGGSDTLATMLANPETDISAINTQRDDIAELAADEQWRAGFMACGLRQPIDTADLKAVVDGVGAMRIRSFAATKIALLMACTTIAGLAAMAGGAVAGLIPASVVATWACLQLALVVGLTQRTLAAIGKAASRLTRQLHTYMELIEAIGSREYVSEGNRRRHATLFGDDSALECFRELTGIADSIDKRANVLGLVIADTLALSDFFLVRRYLRWQKRYVGKIGGWIEAVSTTDALVSLATMRYNEPEARDAQLTEGDAVTLEATNLRHPFLGRKAVGNDFTIADGNYYIITGANMAGKSTFLRAIGTNWLLARCGMPVFADRMTMTVFGLFSSMRTTDDLAKGISYFNAELLRLKQLLDFCRQNRRTLIILDEILKGTNSLDKLNGSKRFLEAVAEMPISGVIATHDLELSKMAEERADRFHNFCFEIQLAENIRYSYKIEEGTAQNQNATFLLDKILAESAADGEGKE